MTRARKKAAPSKAPRAPTILQGQVLRRIAEAAWLQAPFTPFSLAETYGARAVNCAAALRRMGLVAWGPELRPTPAGRRRVGPLGPRPKSGLAAMLALSRLRRSKPMTRKEREREALSRERRALAAWFRWANSFARQPPARSR